MAEGLHSSFYRHFASLLWGDDDSAYLSNPLVDSEWESFTRAVMNICTRYGSLPSKLPSKLPDTAWDFLLDSKFHACYSKKASVSGISLMSTASFRGADYTAANIHDEQNQEMSFYAQLLRETLDSLHALYENLKLDNLRKQ